MTARHFLVVVTLLIVTISTETAQAEATISEHEVRRRALFGLGIEGAAAYAIEQGSDDLFGWGGTIAARLEVNVHPTLGLEAGGVAIILSENQSTESGSWYGGRVGLRFHWTVLLDWTRQDGWIDAHYDLGSSNDELAMGFDVGTGFEFALGRGFRIGPYGRYQFGDDGSGRQSHLLVIGLSIGILGDPRIDQTIVPDEETDEVVTSATTPVVVDESVRLNAAVVESETMRLNRSNDHDGDGIINGRDLCPSDPSGAMPDFSRLGCSVRDFDGDGVRDSIDLCSSEPVGASPDPWHPGCPIRDQDRDGIVDERDHCPADPAGARPDSRNAGCPLQDRDRDGVADDVDLCPDTAAGETPSADNRGCPR